MSAIMLTAKAIVLLGTVGAVVVAIVCTFRIIFELKAKRWALAYALFLISIILTAINNATS